MSAACYYGGENINNLVPRALPKLVKEPIYRSQHRFVQLTMIYVITYMTWRNTVKANANKGKLSQRTMGFAKTPLSPPDQYLKKASQPTNALTAGFKYPVRIFETFNWAQKIIKTTDRRPPVPSHKTEHKAIINQKNFIKEVTLSGSFYKFLKYAL